MVRCVEYLGIDKRTNLRKLGTKEANWNRRVGIVKKHEVFQRPYFKKGTKSCHFNVNTWKWSTTCLLCPFLLEFGHVRKEDEL